jgi:F0F1-type ATP synthase membrane subunit b/b'
MEAHMPTPLTEMLKGRIRESEARLAAARRQVEEIEAEIEDYKRTLDRESRREVANHEGKVNRTVALLKFVKENQAQGVTHKDMRSYLESLGVQVSKNFTYNFVDRFRDRKIIERDGRIYGRD